MIATNEQISYNQFRSFRIFRCTYLDGVNESDDSLVDLQYVLQRDFPDPVDERLVDVLEGGVQAEHLVVLHDGLAGDGHLGLEDGARLRQRHGVALDADGVVDVLEVGLLLGAPERRAARPADLLEGELLLLDALEGGAVDVLDLPARPAPVLHGARVLLIANAVLQGGGQERDTLSTYMLTKCDKILRG